MPAQPNQPYTLEPFRPGADAADARWLPPEWTMFPLAARRCIVRNPLNGSAMELSSGEYAALCACEGWRTLDQHVDRAASRLGAPAEHRPAIRELLDRCARSGLLITVARLVERFGTPAQGEPQRVAAVVIRTADRPRLLARLLASATALEARSASRRRWIVIDDSRDAANQRANRAALEACPALETEHLDRAVLAAVRDQLRGEFPDLDREIRWLLDSGSSVETTAGVPINHALLRLAGHRFVSLDDDAVIAPKRPALVEPGFAVSDAVDELFLYESEAALWRDCPPLEVDPVAAHEQWLGLPLARAWRLAEQHGPLAAMELSGAELERFAPDASVLFTHNHACGDPGSSTLPMQLFALPERSRRRLASQPDAAAYGFAGRINWRGQSRLRLAPRRDLTFTTLAGVDNTRLLPPVPRSYRSTDVLLGLVAQRMYPSSWIADLPFGLPHLREPAKRWLQSEEPYRQAHLHVVHAYISRHVPARAGSAEQRLATMGALLLDLAAAGESHLRETLLQHAIETGADALFRIEQQLDDADLPSGWRAHLAQWLRSPALAPGAAASRALEPSEARPLLEAYGKAMLAWPRLWRFRRERAT
ncbi:MAG TPA: hypothetical protein VFR50_11155 [Casimicrobiaceae bacterium]|nr:hypothetical protein [Casimicrobiaceae bacterium]